MAGTLVIDTLNASSGPLQTNNGMSGIAKAWVNYNSSATTITASWNVSSVTYNSTGLFTINFSTAMPDTAYCVVSAASYVGGTGSPSLMPQSLTTGNVVMNLGYGTGNYNTGINCVAIHR